MYSVSKSRALVWDHSSSPPRSREGWCSSHQVFETQNLSRTQSPSPPNYSDFRNIHVFTYFLPWQSFASLRICRKVKVIMCKCVIHVITPYRNQSELSKAKLMRTLWGNWRTLHQNHYNLGVVCRHFPWRHVFADCLADPEKAANPNSEKYFVFLASSSNEIKENFKLNTQGKKPTSWYSDVLSNVISQRKR